MALGKSHTFNGRTVDGHQIYSVQNNLILPYQFTSLPTGDQGQVRWTESPPINWFQYGPYEDLFNKVYLRRDGSLESIPNGGGNVHSIKTFGIGSALSHLPSANVSVDQYNAFFPENNWSIYQLRYSIFNIPINKNYVNFGCFYKVPANDRLRPLNFGFVRIDFSIASVFFVPPISYINHYTICGENMPTLVGGTDSYYYLNASEDSPPRIYSPYNQWNGSAVIKLKNLGQKIQGPSTDDWQFLNFKVEIPTFSEEDGLVNGKATRVNFKFGFGENLSYLDDDSGINSGSVIFYYPFLNFS
jgi:hypothetical protein